MIGKLSVLGCGKMFVVSESGREREREREREERETDKQADRESGNGRE